MKRCIRLIVSIALAAMAGAAVAQAASAPERAASSAGPAAAASTPAAGKLYAPLTQLDTWPLRIFVSRDIDDPSPKLKLYFADGVVNQPAYCEIVPVDIARHQVWVGGGSADGQDAQHVGTWLLFHLKPDRGRAPTADGSDARAAPYAPAAASGAGAARRLRNCSVPWLKPMARVQAELAWSDADCRDCKLVSNQSYIYLGSSFKAAWWAIAVMVAFTLLVLLALWSAKCHLSDFFLVNGRMSLSLLQMGLWTYAVGFLMLYQLFVALDAVSIPESLIVLMSTSLLTAGASAVLSKDSRDALAKAVTAVRDAMKPLVGTQELPRLRGALSELAAASQASSVDRGLLAHVDTVDAELRPVVDAPATDPAVIAAKDPLRDALNVLRKQVDVLPDTTRTLAPLRTGAGSFRQRLADRGQLVKRRIIELFSVEDDAADGSNLSLSRLQMLFWTIVMIIMFVSKSLITGALWEIPWTLVALMGVSQAGYIGGKFGQAGAPASK